MKVNELIKAKNLNYAACHFVSPVTYLHTHRHKESLCST